MGSFCESHDRHVKQFLGLSEVVGVYPKRDLSLHPSYVPWKSRTLKKGEGETVRPCNFHRKHYFPESPLGPCQIGNPGKKVSPGIVDLLNPY